jgi:hypothetical protein
MGSDGITRHADTDIGYDIYQMWGVTVPLMQANQCASQCGLVLRTSPYSNTHIYCTGHKY